MQDVWYGVKTNSKSYVAFNKITTNNFIQASAVQAKKKGKLLHNHELLLLWQRKKQSKYFFHFEINKSKYTT